MAVTLDIYSKVPVLTEENYSSYATAMKMVLIERGLSKVVFEPIVPVKLEDAALTQKIADEGQKALACIYLSLPMRYRNILDQATDGRDAWQRLKAYFEPDTLAGVMHLKHLFWSTRLEGQDIVQYATKLSVLAEKLKDADEPVSQLDQVFQLLRYLPDEYEGLVQAIYRREKGDLIFTKVLNDVLAEQARLIQRKTDRVHEAWTANSDIDRARKVKESSLAPTIRRCYECHSPNHLRNRCPKLRRRRSKSPWRGSQSPKPGICRESREKSRKSSSLTVSYTSTISTHEWVLDTASTDHVCGVKELFKTFTPTEGRWLGSCIKDKDTPVKGSGDVEILLGNTIMTLRNVLYVPSVSKNLISGYRLDKKGLTFIGRNRQIKVIEDNEIIFTLMSERVYI